MVVGLSTKKNPFMWIKCFSIRYVRNFNNGAHHSSCMQLSPIKGFYAAFAWRMLPYVPQQMEGGRGSGATESREISALYSLPYKIPDPNTTEPNVSTLKPISVLAPPIGCEWPPSPFRTPLSIMAWHIESSPLPHPLPTVWYAVIKIPKRKGVGSLCASIYTHMFGFRVELWPSPGSQASCRAIWSLSLPPTCGWPHLLIPRTQLHMVQPSARGVTLDPGGGWSWKAAHIRHRWTRTHVHCVPTNLPGKFGKRTPPPPPG